MRPLQYFFLTILPAVILSGNCFIGKPATEIGISLEVVEGGSCDDFAKDFEEREAALSPKNWDCSPDENSTWGPWCKLYPKAKIPSHCDKVVWARKRVLAAMDYLIKKGWNYCHHHDPYWVAPPNSNLRVYRSADTCSEYGFPNRVIDMGYLKGWQGLDCSHFAMYTYNFAFGSFLNTGIGAQGCVSSVLKQMSLTKEYADQFQPGDLIYMGNSRVTHVVMWTGYKMGDLVNGVTLSRDYLLKNYAFGSANYNYVQRQLDNAIAKKLTIWVVADSSVNGPNYRVFAGWYRDAFTHASRLIGNENLTSALPVNVKLTWDDANDYCNITRVTSGKRVLQYLMDENR